MIKTSELARAAGVSVRTLRYYDKIGLLEARRDSAGHRLYQQDDLIRLQQIRLLQFVGLTLEQIRASLREPRTLGQSLELQLRVLRERQSQLDRIVRVLTNATEGELDLVTVIKAIEQETTMDWFKKFYDDETWDKVQRRAQNYTPERQQADQKRWQDLFEDARRLQGERLENAEVQELGRRYKAIIDEFTGGDPKILEALKAMHAQGPPPGAPDMGNAILKDFLSQAMAAAGLRLAGSVAEQG